MRGTSARNSRADVPPSLKDLGGTFGGFARLRSADATQRRVLAGLTGDVGLFLENGRLSHRLAEVVEADVGDALDRLLGGGERQGRRTGHHVNCLIGRFG
jgi:hypothetical protein